VFHSSCIVEWRMTKPECPLCRVPIHCNHCNQAESDMFNEHRMVLPTLCRKLQQRNKELQQQLERKQQVDSDALLAARIQLGSRERGDGRTRIPVEYELLALAPAPRPPRMVTMQINGVNRGMTRRVVHGFV